MLPDDLQEMQIESPRAERPYAGVSVCALEVGTTVLLLRINVPAATSFIGYQRSAICLFDCLHKRSIFEDRLESVVNGERMPLYLSKGFGEVVVGLCGEYEVRGCRRCHGRMQMGVGLRL